MSSNETFDTGIVDISEFFSGGDSGTAPLDEPEQKSTFSEVDSPIKELKAIILSLDWEITDEIADSFIAEVDRLAEVWNTDKVVVAFLQILRALGKYLRTHKADAHPDSVNLLYSVYNNFEKIVLTDEISAERERVILNEELQKFTKLKEKIAQAAAALSAGTANESLLSALKSVLLEIDWNITQQTMQKFDIEISKLEKVWSADKTFLTPLQMMRAIGSYVTKHKLKSHPDSIKLLTIVFQNFEKMSLTENMSEDEKKEIIQADLKRFTQLKEQILTVKQEEPEVEEVVALGPLPPAQAPAPRELPGQIYDESAGSATIDMGFVAPIEIDVSGSSQLPPETSDLLPHESETVEEVGSRLDDLFGQDDNDSSSTDLFIDLSSSASDDIEPLPGMKPPEQRGAPAAIEDITPLPAGGGVDIVPLPGLDVPVSIDNPVLEPQGATAIDSHIDDFFGNKVDSPAQSPNEPLTPATLDITDSASPSCDCHKLLSLVSSFNVTAEPVDISPLTSEITILQQASAGNPPLLVLLKLINSMVVYLKFAGIKAHKESLPILHSFTQSLSSIGGKGERTEDQSMTIIQEELEKFTDFQENNILPTLAAMISQEKEIKKILGIAK